MRYNIRIKRESGYQTFIFEGSGDETVSAVLDLLNGRAELTDAEGNTAKRIKWSCSCHQGVCGACSMVINKRPALACKTKLKDLKGDTVTLEPLTKFPLIADLATDRSGLYEAPIVRGVWNSAAAKLDKKQYKLEYAASKCLKCGICVEVCPNTDIIGRNLGAGFAVDCYLAFAKSGDKAERKQLKKAYNKGFAGDCSKSMSCADCCPTKIDIRELINYMNRH